MDLISNLVAGLHVALTPSHVFYCFIGVFLGTAIGVLPGLGTLATVAMLLPLTYSLEPTAALIMLAGIYYGSQYGGSTTAILVNLPGEAASTVTTLDGYQMARRGRAGPALAAAALSSFIAGTIATLLVAAVAKPLTSVALSFGPAEYFSLTILGLASSIALASGGLLKALIMVFFGMLLGLTGTDLYTAMPRFTFGSMELESGIDVAAIAVGAFGIAEIFRNFEPGQSEATAIKNVGNLIPSQEDLKRIIGPALRGTGLGSLLGVLPGSGAILASFMSYNLEKRISRNRNEFGKGAIEGVAAPEAANNAAAQTSFIPMLTLGLPSNAVMALMIGALMIQGITPGPEIILNQPSLFWGLIASMWVGNLMLVILNLPLVGIWIRLLTVPTWILYPSIVAVCCIGVYSLNNSTFSVYILLASSLFGYLAVKGGFELAPFLLGFILSPMMEEYLRKTMSLSGGDPSVFVTQPLSAALLGLALFIILLSALPSIRVRRKEIFVPDD